MIEKKLYQNKPMITDEEQRRQILKELLISCRSSPLSIHDLVEAFQDKINTMMSRHTVMANYLIPSYGSKLLYDEEARIIGVEP